MNPAVLNVARALLLVALGVSAYLAWTSITHGALAGCGPESDCDRVLQSRWSRWFGVPVSAFAVLVDVLALWGTFSIGAGVPSEARRRGEFLAALGLMLILGAGAWFITLQLAAVGICPYCMTAHGAGVVGALVLLFAVKRGATVVGLFGRTGGVAAAALVVLIAGQILQKPPPGRESKIVVTSAHLPFVMPATQTVATPQAVAATPSTQQVVFPPAVTALKTNPAVAQTPAVSNTPPPAATNAPRQTYTPDMGPVSAMMQPFKFYEGLFALDLRDVPVIGAPTNARVIVSLFDYACHHCRAMHPLIHEVQRAFSNDLVVISLPMPLDGKCNRTVTRTPRAHTNSCAYAHLGLAVWRADRAKHAEFDEWLMTGPEPPSVAVAMSRAVSLVGNNALAAAVRDPWVERLLQFDIAIYEVAYRSGHGSMPQLIVGATVSEGTRSREEVLKMLADNLGLKARP